MAEPGDEHTFGEEQKLVYDVIRAGWSVFVTGGGGTGVSSTIYLDYAIYLPMYRVYVVYAQYLRANCINS